VVRDTAMIGALVWCVTSALLPTKDRVTGQRRRFKKSGTKPLIEALNARAAALPQTAAVATPLPASAVAPAKIDELDGLASLKRDGLLSDEEWADAKRRLLEAATPPVPETA
jgi:hypothetical protein